MSYLEQLFITRSHRYFAFTLLAFVLASLCCGYLWTGEERQQYRYVQQHYAQLCQQLEVMQQTVQTASTTVTPTVDFTAPVFSVVETLRQSRGRLIHWQPGERQARLELSIGWERVPALFQHMARYHGLNLTSFHITAATDVRAVVLALEFSYENL